MIANNKKKDVIVMYITVFTDTKSVGKKGINIAEE